MKPWKSIKAVFKGGAEACAAVAAKYKLYLQREDAKLQEEQKRQQLAQAQAAVQRLEQNHLWAYADFGYRAILRCVQDLYMNAELEAPGRSIEAHMAPPGERIVVLADFGVCYQYDFCRHMSLNSRGIGLGFERVFTTLAVQEIANVINETLENYSLSAGYGPARIIKAVDLPKNGRVRFTVGRVPNV